VIAPFRAAVACLVTIPGLSATAAHVIIAEIGVDMSRFATVAHLRSWAGLCPQLNESAGTIMSRRLRHGAPWLKTVLVQFAWAATRNKHNYLHAQVVRLRARRGPQKAIIAVAASILSIAYYLLRNQVPYRDLGALYFIRADQERIAQRLARRIKERLHQRVVPDSANIHKGSRAWRSMCQQCRRLPGQFHILTKIPAGRQNCCA
jgi:transposase